MKSLVAVFLIITLLAVPPSNGSIQESSEYQSPDGTYSYITWGAGSQEQPYGSTVTGLKTDCGTVYIQAALEGYPVRTISSLDGCKSETIVLPSTLKKIEVGAFDGCINLRAIYFLGDMPEGRIPDGIFVSHLEGTSGWNEGEVSLLEVSEDSSGGFSYFIIEGKATVCSAIKGNRISIPSQTIDGLPFRSIGDCAFMGSDVESVIIGEGIEEIGVRAFYGCWSLTDVVYPSTLKVFRDECFRECMRLTSVELSDVEFIGFEAFRECKTISSAIIPESTITLHDGAFYLCRSLRTIEIGHGLTAVPPRCFGYCDSIVEVVLPDDVVDIGWSAFYNCISLESISLSKICSIGDDAFYGCYYLNSIGALASIIYVGDRAFSGCGSMESITLADSLVSVGREAFDRCRSLETLRFLGDMPLLGEYSIPLETEVVCSSSHASSWESYNGNLIVQNDRKEPSQSGVVPWILFSFVGLSVIAIILVLRRRKRITFHRMAALNPSQNGR